MGSSPSASLALSQPSNLENSPSTMQAAPTLTNIINGHDLELFDYKLDDLYLKLINTFPVKFIVMMSDPKLSGETIVEQLDNLTASDKDCMSVMLNAVSAGRLAQFHNEIKEIRAQIDYKVNNIKIYHDQLTNVNQEINETLVTINALQKDIEGASERVFQKERELQNQALQSYDAANLQFQRTRKIGRQNRDHAIVSIERAYNDMSNELTRLKNEITARYESVKGYQFVRLVQDDTDEIPEFDSDIAKKFAHYSAHIQHFLEVVHEFNSMYTQEAIQVAMKFTDDVERYCEIFIEHTLKLVKILDSAFSTEYARRVDYERKAAFLEQLKIKHNHFLSIRRQLEPLFKQVYKTKLAITRRQHHR